MSSELRHSTGPERTLEQRDLQIMRPAKERAPRPRKQTVLREVTNGIVCFCGERFAEGQALDFMLHLRAEVGEVLAWRSKQVAAWRAANKREWARIKADPERLARKYAIAQESVQRMMQDPEYAERRRLQRREASRNYAARKRAEMKAGDPEAYQAWRDSINEAARRRYKARGTAD